MKTSVHTTTWPRRFATKALAVMRRGLPSLRNVVFSWFDYWPTSSLSGHWIQDVPVYCISLARAEQRRAVILSQAKRIGLRRFFLIEAVNAADLRMERLMADGVYDHEESLRWHANGLTINEIACSLSHVECYRRITAAGDPFALIIEDDALFRSSRLRRLDLKDLPEWADLAFLNSFLDRNPPWGPVGKGWYSDESYCGSSAAYLVRRRTAQALLEAAVPVVHAADGLLGRALMWRGNDPHKFRQQGSRLALRALIAYPEAVTNGSTEHFYRSSLR